MTLSKDTAGDYKRFLLGVEINLSHVRPIVAICIHVLSCWNPPSEPHQTESVPQNKRLQSIAFSFSKYIRKSQPSHRSIPSPTTMSTDFEALCVEGNESQEICDLYAVSEKDVNGRGENKNNSNSVSPNAILCNAPLRSQPTLVLTLVSLLIYQQPTAGQALGNI